MGAVIDITGETFGRLTVLKRHGSSKCKKAMWKCVCECGNTKIIQGSSIRHGLTRSCGCLSLEVAKKVNSKWDHVFTDPRMTKAKRLKILNTYHGMTRRVSGKCVKAPQYKGIPLCGLEDFAHWSQSDDDFHYQYDAWEANGKNRSSTPSIDKESYDTGYMLGFMNWIPLRDNVSKANKERVKIPGVGSC